MAFSVQAYLPDEVIEGYDWSPNVQGRVCDISNVVLERIQMQRMSDRYTMLVIKHLICLKV